MSPFHSQAKRLVPEARGILAACCSGKVPVGIPRIINRSLADDVVGQVYLAFSMTLRRGRTATEQEGVRYVRDGVQLMDGHHDLDSWCGVGGSSATAF